MNEFTKNDKNYLFKVSVKVIKFKYFYTCGIYVNIDYRR